ncbi:four helix bundle protein [Candidatus Peribacteria bacterium]|nr:MAG: four helix bundle protein [Candidatus Peribacteria bacterium]
MQSYRDLEAWKNGLDLIEEIYRLTEKFPRTELYEMTSQMRSASTSILANLAEGFGRFTYADKANKYTIARGECTEVEAFLYIAIRIKFAPQEHIQKALQIVERQRRLLSGLIESTKRNLQKSP